ncbi:MAG: dockerin type I domain-containing protein, partial [Firmicutes bacterium]|nr:dockerin type I domain-containing protein [Bacillota bacterium]
SEDNDYVYNGDFEATLNSQGFPESYKPYLRKLHANHPNWVFKAQNTNLSWNDVIVSESKVGRNLVHNSADDSWKSKEYGAYDYNTNQYVVFDSGGWVAASRGIIMYYMDPRNFLDENGIFQFMSHSYDSLTQTKEGLQKLVAGSFLANKFPESGYDTYSDALIYAGQQSNANPYVLASMILVEQGNNGSGKSISGTVSGYENLYNYFNVNAYSTSAQSDAVINGLIYAREKGWTTRIKSIVEGAKHYATNYINNNQNTLYLKKFNVMNGFSNVSTHQYMTNVSGAAQEAAKLKSGYAGSDTITFYIPVYKEMPASACPLPSSGNNDYFLKSLEVSGYDLLPDFNMYTDKYELVVGSDVTSINVKAVANNSDSRVSGAGTVNLTSNVTDVKIVVTASSGESKTYVITVARASGGSANISSSKYKVGSEITGVGFNTSVDSFKSNISVPSGHSFKVLDKNGNEMTTGNVGTNTKVVVYNGSQAVTSIPIIIKGDANGDGKVSSADVLFAQRYIINTYNLSGAYLKGADVNGDGKVSSVDVLFMQRSIIGTYEIKN